LIKVDETVNCHYVFGFSALFDVENITFDTKLIRNSLPKPLAALITIILKWILLEKFDSWCVNLSIYSRMFGRDSLDVWLHNPWIAVSSFYVELLNK